MSFEIYKNGQVASIVLEETLNDELAKMVGIFAGDIERVSGKAPSVHNSISSDIKNIILVSVAGKSRLLEQFNNKLSDIQGKTECYSIFTADNAYNNGQNVLVIAGSDKRGAIYGMFHLSEIMGVSPWYYWADANVKKKDEVVLTEEAFITSKEPSVRYRGLFINDEQPCFGNWAKEKFGSIKPGPELYEKIFELILRLKGNYIWPAMWRSDFTLDNIENARLATEMGIIVGASHHEPCCRSGQEFQTLNKSNPQYGKEWSFLSNAAGITEFWKDGLIRNKNFENLITIGMRGENDSHLMPENATLKDNIDVLKAVITKQKELINKFAPSEHPQLLAIYKEVEDYFYGDENTPGLKDWDLIKDDIMMLCDDNFANVRTLPDEELRKHPGGFGIYYHFDYFGGPVSYLWINSSPLTKIWEQMTMAYDFGIRSAWIVNVGDIKNQELPLSYFLDLAYDFENYGTSAINKTVDYTIKFFEKAGFEKDFSKLATKVLTECVRLNAKRKPEALKSDTYHPVHEHESEEILEIIDKMTSDTEKLYQEIKGTALEDCFFQLVYYPVNAVAAINRMQIYAGLNKLYAKQGKKKANSYAMLVKKYIEAERTLTDEYHSRNGGKWNHMQSVAHIGYNNWNEERWNYPLTQNYYPVKDSRLLVSLTDTDDSTNANRWTRHILQLPICLDICPTNTIEIANGGEKDLSYRIDCSDDYINIESIDEQPISKNTCYTLDDTIKLQISVDKNKWNGSPDTSIIIYGDNCEELADESENCTSITLVEVKVLISENDISKVTDNCHLESNGCISIEAIHYAKNIPSINAEYKAIEDFGRTLGGVKAYPQTLSFKNEIEAPALEYHVFSNNEGEYTCFLYAADSNPVEYKGKMQVRLKANDNDSIIVNTIPDAGFIPWKSPSWSKGVLDHIHIGTCKLKLKKGSNTIRLIAMDPAVVTEKIVLWNPNAMIRDSYLGPKESKIIF